MSQAPFIFLSDHSNISIAFVTSVHVHVHLDKFPAKMQKFAFAEKSFTFYCYDGSFSRTNFMSKSIVSCDFFAVCLPCKVE